MKKRYIEFDILRGLAIIGVIWIHISAPVLENSINGSITEGVALFFNQSSRFAVPAFLFLSGWGLTTSKKYKQGYFLFLKEQILKVLPLYFIWSIIYHIINYQTFNILGFIKGFILGYNNYHLYYVPIIIFFYLIYPFLLKISKINIGLFSILFITVLSQVADFFTGVNILNDARNIFNWVFYFVLGIWFAKNFRTMVEKVKQNKRMIKAVYLTLLVFLVTSTYSLIDKMDYDMATTSMRPEIILYSVFFIALVICIDWKAGIFTKIALKLSEISYGLYLSHALVLNVYYRVYISLGLSTETITYMVTAFLIVTTISILVTILMDKFIYIITNVRKKDIRSIIE